jgi:DNA oxidative demethylase
MSTPAGPPGLHYIPGYLSREEQQKVLAAIRRVLEEAPLFSPRMPRTGKPLSVGYRYQATHPDTGIRWPAIPDVILGTWRELAEYPFAPEACLINFYASTARMGLHQDRDEEDFAAPVVSLSLGDTCLFRIGGEHRNDPTRSFRLASGDAVVLGGESRLIFHGVDRIIPGTSALLPEGGRINLTLRRVTKPG